MAQMNELCLFVSLSPLHPIHRPSFFFFSKRGSPKVAPPAPHHVQPDKTSVAGHGRQSLGPLKVAARGGRLACCKGREEGENCALLL